ncbi:MAG TPA: CAP domain-containing protein [Kofleriaceae bacterium]|nr:CAP domain-containing protein [Kofleriaceae bacterium]
MVRALALVIPFVMACGGGGHVMEADDMPEPPDAAGGGATGEPAALAGITMFHNQIRAMVDTTGIAGGALPDLVWDDALARTAATWAAKCTDTDHDGLLDHNDGRSDGQPFYVGENIFASTGAATAHDAVFGWAAEGANYHYAANTCDGGKVCGHYTQVVWRATQKVGCALHDCAGLTFRSTIVCDYGPGGNINNQRPY